MNICADTKAGCKMVFDSGTSMVAGPSHSMQNLLSHLNVESYVHRMFPVGGGGEGRRNGVHQDFDCIVGTFAQLKNT